MYYKFREAKNKGLKSRIKRRKYLEKKDLVEANVTRVSEIKNDS